MLVTETLSKSVDTSETLTDDPAADTGNVPRCTSSHIAIIVFNPEFWAYIVDLKRDELTES